MVGGLLLLIVGGLLTVMAMSPVSKIAWQFVRLIAVIALAVCTALATWAVLQHRAEGGSVGGAVIGCLMLCGGVAFVLCVLAPLPRARFTTGLVRAIGLVGGLAGVTGAVMWLDADVAAPGGLWMPRSLGHLLAAFYLGGVTYAWLLGHRYLTATEMTIDPLVRAAKLLLFAVGARWLFLAAAAAGAVWVAVAGSAPEDPWASIRAEWFLIAVRIGVGLILPSVFAYMAWQCVKLRSTQSATGILFFMSIFVIIGELTSQHLSGKLGLPL